MIMKRFNKVYLEISNICNLKCSFCPGTRRKKHAMTEEELSVLLPKLRPYSDFLYFHLMGEPLCHPLLASFLEIAGESCFKVILTTNGTLLKAKEDILLSSPALHKVNISLHAFEANDLSVPFEKYLQDCFSFGKAAEGKKIIVYRLWNHGGAEERNAEILAAMESYFPKPWKEDRRGVRIGEKVFLEYGDKFDWPDLTAPEGSHRVFCYGLRDQIGVLCDGSVVPCCLDADGVITLGNIFEESLDDILQKPRACALRRSFENRNITEPLCLRCGFAAQRVK